jgi:hypothetical protein
VADRTPSDDLDLDEDLFDFDPPDGALAAPESDEEDLEAIFSAFQEQEADSGFGFPSDETEPVLVGEPAVEDFAPPFPAPVQEPTDLSPVFAVDPHDVDDADEDVFGFDEVDSTTFRAQERAPAPAAAPVQPAQGGGLLSRSTILVLMSIATLNVMVAVVALRSAATMRDSVLDVERRMAETASEMRSLSTDQGREILQLRKPLVAPNAGDHPTFERAREEIEDGDFAGARQRLYSLLSVVDRLEDSQRREVEARAQFLLAEATHLEAVARLEGDR